MPEDFDSFSDNIVKLQECCPNITSKDIQILLVPIYDTNCDFPSDLITRITGVSDYYPDKDCVKLIFVPLCSKNINENSKLCKDIIKFKKTQKTNNVDNNSISKANYNSLCVEVLSVAELLSVPICHEDISKILLPELL